MFRTRMLRTPTSNGSGSRASPSSAEEAERVPSGTVDAADGAGAAAADAVATFGGDADSAAAEREARAAREAELSRARAEHAARLQALQGRRRMLRGLVRELQQRLETHDSAASERVGEVEQEARRAAAERDVLRVELEEARALLDLQQARARAHLEEQQREWAAISDAALRKLQTKDATIRRLRDELARIVEAAQLGIDLPGDVGSSMLTAPASADRPMDARALAPVAVGAASSPAAAPSSPQQRGATASRAVQRSLRFADGGAQADAERGQRRDEGGNEGT